MNDRPDNTSLKLKTRRGQCPTCGQYARFTLIGQQQWPLRVVAATGVGPVVHLWMCGQCQTTLTETAAEING